MYQRAVIGIVKSIFVAACVFALVWTALAVLDFWLKLGWGFKVDEIWAGPLLGLLAFAGVRFVNFVARIMAKF